MGVISGGSEMRCLLVVLFIAVFCLGFGLGEGQEEKRNEGSQVLIKAMIDIPEDQYLHSQATINEVDYEFVVYKAKDSYFTINGNKFKVSP